MLCTTAQCTAAAARATRATTTRHDKAEQPQRTMPPVVHTEDQMGLLLHSPPLLLQLPDNHAGSNDSSAGPSAEQHTRHNTPRTATRVTLIGAFIAAMTLQGAGRSNCVGAGSHVTVNGALHHSQLLNMYNPQHLAARTCTGYDCTHKAAPRLEEVVHPHEQRLHRRPPAVPPRWH